MSAGGSRDGPLRAQHLSPLLGCQNEAPWSPPAAPGAACSLPSMPGMGASSGLRGTAKQPLVGPRVPQVSGGSHNLEVTRDPLSRLLGEASAAAFC